MSYYIFKNSEVEAYQDSESESFSPGLSFRTDQSPTRSMHSCEKNEDKNLTHSGSEPNIGLGSMIRLRNRTSF